MGDLVGRTLAHFRIEAELGEGGMGVVYRATDEKLRRQVALKVLPESFAKDEERRRRFLREARSAAAVTHANIATVYEADEADGHVYIAMELVDGETLRARLDAGVSIPEGVRIAKDIARGLARAHEKGIIHRDLKPENVMISRHGEVKILDFGLAKVRDEGVPNPGAPGKARTESKLTEEGRVLGTPAYMSPEQAQGQPVDARADVFSFGVLFFELLTGQRPFDGETAMAVMIAASRDTPKRASEVNPLVPGEIDRIVARCLEKQSDARYANGQELLDALSAVLPEPRVSEPSSGRKGPSAPTVSLLTPGASAVTPRGTARWRWGLAVIAGLAAAGLVLGYRARGTSATLAAVAPATSVHGDADATRGKAITDHPPPKTKSPEALVAYASALQYLRDGSLPLTIGELRRATKLDPAFAAAHIRVVLNWGSTLTERRESYSAAMQFRGSLDDRDALLLHAAESLTREKTDHDDLAVRLRTVLERFPEDAETLLYLGRFSSDAVGRPILEHAIQVDPKFAGALQVLAGSYYNTDWDEALRLLDRCLEVSPSATSCVRVASYIRRDRGQCALFEDDARRNVRIAPKDPRAHEFLAAALAARGAPIESVRGALDKRTALDEETDPTRAKRDRLETGLALATLTGDFSEATVALRELDRLLEGDTSLSSHLKLALALMSFLEEEGDGPTARRVAESFEKRAPAWTANDADWVRLRLLYMQHHARRLGDADFKRAREAFEQEALRWEERDDVKMQAYVRLWVYARYAEGPDEIYDALPRAKVETVASLWPQYDVGRLYLIAGKTDDALPPLRRTAAACNVLPDLEEGRLDVAVWYMHAHLWLGQALEAKGDKPGACDAYGVILDRWKNAKPRSITLEKAKERAKTLACPR